MKSFKATIKDGCSLGAFIKIPFDIEKEFGKKRIKVKGTMDDISFSGVICYVIPFGFIIVIKNTLLEKVNKQVKEELTVNLKIE